MSKFIFKNAVPGRRVYEFQCTLQSRQCIALTSKGQQCRRKLSKGLPVCWFHLKQVFHIIIKPSTIAAAGTGMFACDPEGRRHQVVFRKGDVICPYVGTVLTKTALNRRYGRPADITAPYSTGGLRNTVIDAACVRGAAAYANDARNERNNAILATMQLNRAQQRELNEGIAPGHHFPAKIVALVADKDIQQDEEIFATYGPEYWEDGTSTNRTTGAKPRRRC